MTFFGLEIITLILLLYFGIIGPVLGMRDMRKLVAAVAAGHTDARARWYKHTIVYLWGALVVGLGAWLLLGHGVVEIGLWPFASGWQWLAWVVSLALCAVLGFVSARTMGRPDELASVRSQLGDLTAIVPHTNNELRLFYGVSISAGISEEIIFRGLIMAPLAAAWGVVPAVLVSSIVFGLSHTYQGASGALRSSLVGLVLALSVVFTGSLYAAIILHAILDMTQGQMAQAALASGKDAAPEAIEAIGQGATT